MRSHDWSATPVGAVDSWPTSLRAIVRVLLDCRLPMYIAWGPQFTQFFNDAYVPILGAKFHGALGGDARMTWSEIWPTIGPMWEKVLGGGGIGSERFKLTIERYGYPEDCYFSFSYSAVPDDEGKPAGVLVTFAETTREVLAEQRQTFQLALTDAINGLSDPLDITERAAAMLGAYIGAGRSGYGEVNDDLGTVSVTRDWTDGVMGTLAGESRPLDSFGPDIIATLRSGRTLRLDDVAANPLSAPYAPGYASINTLSLMVVPLVKKGRLTAILYLHCANCRRWTDADEAVAQDVAHRTWDAIERARAERALVIANQRKDEFLAMLAHELRNPLAPIASAAQLLELGGLDHGRVVKTGKLISRQVGHMSTLLDDLLDVSRVTRGVVELDLQVVDMAAVVDAAIEQIRPLMNKRGHLIDYHPPAFPLTVLGDPVRLVQAVSNVLNNSAKYTPDGGRVSVALSADAGAVELVISDTGQGLSAALLPHAFDLFVQGQRGLGRPQGGLGLGLALVRSILELHGGTVELRSDGEGHGTTVRFDLPLHTADDAALGPSVATALPVVDQGRLYILLVDDNQDITDMIGQLLETLGHSVYIANSAQQALSVSESFLPQIVILDIGLPDVDGYELIAMLKTKYQAIPPRYVALTGYGGALDKRRAREAGFWRHLTKPVALSDLYSVLDP